MEVMVCSTCKVLTLPCSYTYREMSRMKSYTKSDQMDPILSGRTCPYCGGESTLIHNSEIYGRDFGNGNMWSCKPCDAYVGCHPGTDVALGRLANANLRAWRKALKGIFDPLWKLKRAKHSLSKTKARKMAYKWLSEQMGIDVSKCHVGYFDVEQCQQAYNIIIKVYKKMNWKNFTVLSVFTLPLLASFIF